MLSTLCNVNKAVLLPISKRYWANLECINTRCKAAFRIQKDNLWFCLFYFRRKEWREKISNKKSFEVYLFNVDVERKSRMKIQGGSSVSSFLPRIVPYCQNSTLNSVVVDTRSTSDESSLRHKLSCLVFIYEEEDEGMKEGRQLSRRMN